jgi:tetratricopeptide (TPR) repeat protein
VSRHPGLDDPRLQQAQAYLDARRPAEAARLAGEYLALHPDSDEAMFVLALAHDANGDMAGALQTAEQMATRFPEQAHTWLLLAQLHVSAGMAARAVEAAERAVRLAPGLWATHAVLAATLRAYSGQAKRRRRRTLRQALAAADTAVRLAPEEPSTHLERGSVWLALNRPARAAAAFQEALRLDPTSRPAHNALGAAAAGRLRLFRAADTLAQTLREDPEDHDTWHDFVRVVGSAAMLTVVVGTIVLGLSLRLLYFSTGDNFDAPVQPSDRWWPTLIITGGLVALVVYAVKLWRSGRTHTTVLWHHHKVVVLWLALIPAALLAELVLLLGGAPYSTILWIVLPPHIAGMVLPFYVQRTWKRRDEEDRYRSLPRDVRTQEQERLTEESRRLRRRRRRVIVVLSVLVVLVIGLELFAQAEAQGYLPHYRWWIMGTGVAVTGLLGIPVVTKLTLRIARLQRLAQLPPERSPC